MKVLVTSRTVITSGGAAHHFEEGETYEVSPELYRRLTSKGVVTIPTDAAPSGDSAEPSGEPSGDGQGEGEQGGQGEPGGDDHTTGKKAKK